MFRAVPLPIIRSPFTVHLALAYVIQVCTQLSNRTRMELQFHPGPARKLYDIYQCRVYSKWTPDYGQRNSPKYVEVHFLSKINFGKLVHLIGFIIKEICYDAARSYEFKNHYESCAVILSINTFAASYLNTQGLNNSCLKSRQRRPQSI